MAFATAESKRWELLAKGYPPNMVSAAIERAIGTAHKRVEPVNIAIKDHAFHDILVAELHQTEHGATN